MDLKIYLSKITVKKISEHLRKARDVGDQQVILRTTALLFVSQGIPVAKAAELLEVSAQSIYTWLREFILEGMDSFVYKRSPGRPPRLTGAQRKRLVELLKAGPEAAGYSIGCWNSILVQDLISREFKVTYNRLYVCALLHNLGFSWQKARYVSDHLDKEARRRWISIEWPKILREAKERGALLLFGDECSFAQWGSLSYTWAPCGEQPTVPTSGKRKAYKVFGAIDVFSGCLFYVGITGRFNSESYQEFLMKILKNTTQPVILIQDGAKYHTSKATRDFFLAHKDRLTVYQLPSYSPDYNPIEYLWRKVKQRGTHNRYFPEFELLQQSVEVTLAYFAEHPEEVRGLMGTYVKEMVEDTAA